MTAITFTLPKHLWRIANACNRTDGLQNAACVYFADSQPVGTALITEVPVGDQNRLRRTLKVLCRFCNVQPYELHIIKTSIDSAAGRLNVWRVAVLDTWHGRAAYLYGVLSAESRRWRGYRKTVQS